MAGTLAAWGMNIVKAAAFSNRAGVVVDTFFFTDRFRTLELNLPEWERFKAKIHDVLVGKADLDRMLKDRIRSEKNAIAKVKIETKIEIDNESSPHSTLVEVIAQDQLGLLHRISSQFAREDCNIEIAIDRNGRPDGHRRLLPHLRGAETDARDPRSGFARRCCRNWPPNRRLVSGIQATLVAARVYLLRQVRASK